MEEKSIEEIVRFLKVNPAFGHLKGWVEKQLEKERDNYERVEANEFLRGRVSILKHLVAELEK